MVGMVATGLYIFDDPNLDRSRLVRDRNQHFSNQQRGVGYVFIENTSNP